MAIEVEPDFGRKLGKGDVGEITAWLDGTTNRAREPTPSIWSGCEVFLRRSCEAAPGVFPSRARGRDRDAALAYNPTFESVYAIVPSVPAILLISSQRSWLAVSVVREKGAGSIDQPLRHADPPA